jgi:NRAMP (natural resistance-associated macrophage protein)-like metal ion transporter
VGKEKPTKPNFVRRFFSKLGPGVITGAADDDPSGIATYSIAGAQMGTAMLWTALITWPFMACVQFMCARIGMVTGMGLGDALRRKGPRWLLFGGASGLLIANTINVGSDLSGMADAAGMLTGLNSHIYVLIFGAGITYATIRFRYHQIATIMKWLAAVLFAYVITAFTIGPDWGSVLRDTFVPSWPRDHAAWQNLVAILGTTISPYLFFWQASQEVEEEKAMGRRLLVQREGATKREIVDRKIDVGAGTFFSNFVMYFIILTTALTLHKHGIKDIETSKQAAEALRPLAGTLAYLLYTIGIIGVGFLAIPTLAGSAAYAFAGNIFMAGRSGRTISRCPSLLCRPDFFDAARRRHGFFGSESGARVILDSDNQRFARAVLARRRSHRRVRSQTDAGPTQLVVIENFSWNHYAGHVRRSRGHVFAVNLVASSILS